MVQRHNDVKPAKKTSLECSSNDVSLAIYEVLIGPPSCLEGQVIDVQLRGDLSPPPLNGGTLELSCPQMAERQIR